MAERAPDPDEPLDVRKIRYLVRLMKRYDLTDLNLSDGRVQIRLRRRGPESGFAAPHAALAQAIPPSGAQSFAIASPPPAALSSQPASAVLETPAAPKTVVIKSPMVGTYYSSSAPDAPPFVSVGTVVQPESTVCIIEAMKVFTDIPAGLSGTIAEVLVKSGQPVEFDQPLFRVHSS
jgi:acetyl-CoA carboxylase biotin carboxyl carrier protein